MKEIILKLYNKNAITLFIILFPIIEAITSVCKIFYNFKISTGIIYKTIFVIYGLIYILFFAKDEKRLFINKCSLVFFAIFVALHLYIVGLSFIAINNLSIITTYVISMLFVYNYLKDGNIIETKALVYSSLLYCLSVKLAILTNTQIATYANDLSRGTTGWFYSGNELSTILSIFLPVTMYYALKEKMSYKKIVYVITCLLLINTVTNIGTRTALFATLAICIIYTIYVFAMYLTKNIKERKAEKKETGANEKRKENIFQKIFSKKTYTNSSLPILTIILILAYTIIILPNTASYKTFESRFNIINTQNNNTIGTTYEEETDTNNMQDIQKLILNGRNDFLNKQKQLYNKTTLIEKIIGTKYENRLGFQETNEAKNIELDPFDIIIKYGIIGVIIYYTPIIYIMVYAILNISKINKQKNKYEIYALMLGYILALIISIIAGHVLISSTIVIYLSIISIKIICADNINNIENTEENYENMCNNA